MGWVSIYPNHEGWPVALQEDAAGGLAKNEHFRELSYPADKQSGLRVDAIQAGCDCGWRSARFTVAAGVVQWFPFSPDVPEFLEGKLREQWAQHITDVHARRSP